VAAPGPEETSPELLLRRLDAHLSGRQLRLFACACCRRVPLLSAEGPILAAVETAERFADGEATGVELDTAGQALGPWGPGPARFRQAAAATLTGYWFRCIDAILTARYVAQAWEEASGGTNASTLQRAQVALLRDIAGEPPCPKFDPTWLGWDRGGLREMAWAIYRDRTFADLPILGDALEDAGCTHTTILGHCRASAVHVRGCWVLDALLGKE
jgi:hypothetical protein